MRKHSGAFSLKKRYLLTAFGLVLVVAVIGVAYKVIHDWEFKDDMPSQTRQPGKSLADDSDQEDRPMIYFNDSWYVLRKDLETVLMMGLDKYDEDLNDKAVYRNNQQTDFMMLLVMDGKAKTYTAIHINRDTMTRIPTLSVDGKFAGYIDAQLTLAHTYGSGKADSCENAVRAVSEFLYGMEIDHYITITMDAVQILNDSVGGVTVTLEDDFTFLDPRMETGSTVTLHGSEALGYVRARGALEDSTNLSRMKRQRQFLDSLYTKWQTASEEDSGFAMKTLLGINDYMSSDCTLQQLSDISEQLKDYEFIGIQDIPGEAVKGEKYMEYYADDAALSEMLVGIFYEPKKTGLFS